MHLDLAASYVYSCSSTYTACFVLGRVLILLCQVRRALHVELIHNLSLRIHVKGQDGLVNIPCGIQIDRSLGAPI